MTETLAPAPWQLSNEELTAELLACEQNLRVAFAAALELTAEAAGRALGTSLGYKDTAAMLREVLRISGREAQARVALAAATMSSSSHIGAPTPPILAATGDALAAGALDREHAAAISAVLRQCPTGISGEQRSEGEATLVALARQAPPESVRTAGRRLVAHWEQETEPPEEKAERETRPRRSLEIARRPDGSSRFSGELDAETTILFEGLLGPLAKPRADGDGADGTDLRTPAERRGDALAEILGLAARCDDLSVQGGERAAMIVSTTLDELQRHDTVAHSAMPGFGNVDALLRNACEAKVIPAVFDTSGQPLFVGRASRFTTTAQRHALTLRDKGCAHPGCDRGPKWTTPHHVVPWARGGGTDLTNLVLLCQTHHRIVHHSEWEIRFRDGIPEFLPPAWLDPARTPRRNHVHDTGPPLTEDDTGTWARAS